MICSAEMVSMPANSRYVWCSSCSPVCAGSGAGVIVVSPLLVTVSGAPGTTQAFGVELINQSMEDIELVYRPVSIIQTLDGRFVEDTGNLQERSAASWVSLSGELTLQASERYILTGIITIPRNYEGGAYAGIVVPQDPSR